MALKFFKKISIIIPVYNEEKTIKTIVDRVIKSNTLNLSKEIVIIDDGSKDNTNKIVSKFKGKQFKLIRHKKNKGKGAALRTGFKKATGDIILIQDADLEYHPKEYPKLIRPIILNKTRVVYGSRELSGKNIHSSLIFHLGGKIVTFFTNILYRSKLTDEATGYKVFDADFLKSLPLKCTGFEFCPEVTALTLKRKVNIKEVAIMYSARHRHEGKKIKARDGFCAIYTLLKYKLKPL